MKIELIKGIGGPNGYSHFPVVVMQIDLEAFRGKNAADFPGLKDRMLQLMPELKKHCCSESGPEGEFLEKMDEGTQLAHVIEHAVGELLALSGLADRRKRSCRGDELDPSRAVVETTAVETTKYLMPFGAELVEAAATGKEYFFEEKIVEAKRIADDAAISP